MISVTIEGDESAVVAMLYGHLLAFFNQSPETWNEEFEYVRLVYDQHASKFRSEDTVKIPSIYNAGVLYRTEAYATAETPYQALWRSLQELLPPRLYSMLYEDFKLKNAAYSRAKYNATRRAGVKQERMDL